MKSLSPFINEEARQAQSLATAIEDAVTRTAAGFTSTPMAGAALLALAAVTGSFLASLPKASRRAARRDFDAAVKRQIAHIPEHQQGNMQVINVSGTRQ